MSYSCTCRSARKACSPASRSACEGELTTTFNRSLSRWYLRNLPVKGMGAPASTSSIYVGKPIPVDLQIIGLGLSDGFAPDCTSAGELANGRLPQAPHNRWNLRKLGQLGMVCAASKPCAPPQMCPATEMLFTKFTNPAGLRLPKIINTSEALLPRRMVQLTLELS